MDPAPTVPAYVAGTTFVREKGGINEYLLDSNGLRMLLAAVPEVPVAGFMVTYHVGSRNEATGYTGATHLLEHLMFKGSAHFNKENKNTIWEALETKGALVNATTWTDRTNYFEVVPSAHLPLAIALEADRMRRARILEADRQSEMTVVRNEFERGENDPLEAMDKQMWALAYQAHPYHHSTIGWRSDIEQVPIERLKRFYDDFYWPDNATVSVVGGFDEAEVLALLVKEFGALLAHTGPYPEMYTEEPKQEGERRAVVKRSGEADIMAFGYKIPAANHDDVPALIMLSAVLAVGNTSRLHRACLDTAKMTNVFCTVHQFRDPSLLTVYLTLAPKTTHAEAESLLEKQLRLIKEKGVTKTELERARRFVRADIAARRDGPYALLASLNEDIATGDWTRFVTLPPRLLAVKESDIRAVAKRYLHADMRTVIEFHAVRTSANSKKMSAKRRARRTPRA